MTIEEVKQAIKDENISLSDESLNLLTEMTLETIMKNPQKWGIMKMKS